MKPDVVFPPFDKGMVAIAEGGRSRGAPGMKVRVGRIYDETGGWRVFVDRLWPRGVRKDEAPWDEWRKDLAPSDALRKAFHGGVMDHAAFRRAYLEELDARNDVPGLTGEEVVLVTAAREPDRSHVVVLRDWLAGR